MIDKHLVSVFNCEEMSNDPAHARRVILREYLVEIARDLVSRGQVRRQRGQSFEDVIRTEPRAVLTQVGEDLMIVGAELGATLAFGLGALLGQRVNGPAGEVVAAAGRGVANWLTGLVANKK